MSTFSIDIYFARLPDDCPHDDIAKCVNSKKTRLTSSDCPEKQKQAKHNQYSAQLWFILYIYIYIAFSFFFLYTNVYKNSMWIINKWQQTCEIDDSPRHSNSTILVLCLFNAEHCGKKLIPVLGIENWVLPVVSYRIHSIIYL